MANYTYYQPYARYVDHDADPSTPDILSGFMGWNSGMARSKAGDINGDHIIDMLDIMLIESAIGNDGKAHEELDFDKDGKITEYDLGVALTNFGYTSRFYTDGVEIPERVDMHMGHTPMSIAYKYNLLHIIDRLEDRLEEIEEQDALELN